jgi:hypothetical protein
MGLRQFIFGHEVAKEAHMAAAGKLGAGAKALWNFLDGWKTWIWAVIMALKLAFPHVPVWDYVDAAASALGWSHVLPAVDPGQIVQWATFALAVGHKFVKAIRAYRAGVPVADIGSANL